MAGLSDFKRKEYRDAKAQMILNWYSQCVSERADWESMQLFNWKLLTGKVPRVNEPWPGASNVHIPFIGKMVDAMLARYVATHFGTDPIANVEPIEPGDIEDSDVQEKFLNWALSNEIYDFFNQCYMWWYMTCVDGTSVMKTTWDRRWRKVRHKYIRSRFAAPGDVIGGEEVNEPTELQDIDFLVDTFVLDPQTPARRKKGNTWLIKQRIDNRFVDTEVEIVYSEDPDEDLVEIYAAHEDLVYNAPRVEWKVLNTLYMPYHFPDIQESPYVLEEVWLSLADLSARRDAGTYKFTREEWQDIVDLDEGGGVVAEDKMREAAIDAEQGVSSPKFAPGYREGKFRVFETYCFDDIHDDFSECHMVYAVVEATSTLCRWQYLEEEFPHGRRPYAVIKYDPVPDRFYGRSLIERQAGIQMEINTVFNLTNDREALVNNPFYFYEPSAGQDPNQYMRVKPGEGIPVADPSKIVFPQWGRNPMAGMEIFQALMFLGEDLEGIGPTQSGQRRPGATPRTARGTGMMIAEGNIRIDSRTKIAQEGFKELLQQIFALYQEFVEDGKYYRVVGEDRPRELAKKDLRGRVDFVISGNTANTNREMRQNRATVILTTLMQNPLYQQDLGAMKGLIKFYLRAYDDGDVNINDLVPQIPVPLRPRTPDEVIGLLMQGFTVEPRQGEDPQTMIAALDKFASKNEFMAIPQSYVPLFANTRNAYQALGQLMAQAQAGAGAAAQQPATTAGEPPSAPMAATAGEGLFPQAR